MVIVQAAEMSLVIAAVSPTPLAMMLPDQLAELVQLPEAVPVQVPLAACAVKEESNPRRVARQRSRTARLTRAVFNNVVVFIGIVWVSELRVSSSVHSCREFSGLIRTLTGESNIADPRGQKFTPENTSGNEWIHQP